MSALSKEQSNRLKFWTRRFFVRATAAVASFSLVVALAPAPALAATAFQDVASALQQTDVAAAPAAEDQVIVVYEDSIQGRQAARSVEDAQSLGGVEVEDVEEVEAEVAGEGSGQLLVLETQEAQAVIDELQDTPGVAFAQRNFVYSLLEGQKVEGFSVNDTRAGEQYHLKAWDESFSGDCGANVAAAWDLVGQGEEVTVAVLDSGCLMSHPDLSANLLGDLAYDAVNDAVGAASMADGSGHGTHVAGIVAAVCDNDMGVAGTAGNWAKVLPVDVEQGGDITTFHLLKAYSYLQSLMDAGELDDLHVINMSLGGYGNLAAEDYALHKAIDEMAQRDVLTVCAGGNGNNGAAVTEAIFPGDYETCLCVTALDRDGANATYSDYNEFKDVSAPGTSILSTVRSGDYALMSGTSMATPVVSGIAALLWANNPGLSVNQVRQALSATAHTVNGARNNHEGETGSAGAVDAAAALAYSAEHFVQQRTSLAGASVVLSQSVYEYSGVANEPAVAVTLNGVVLQEGVDYKVNYFANVDAGEARVRVEGIGLYRGAATSTFTVMPRSLSGARVKVEPGVFEYNGRPHCPAITVIWGDVELFWGQDYELTDPKNGATSVGTHTYTITGKGNYQGTRQASFVVKRTMVKGSTQTIGGVTYAVSATGGSASGRSVYVKSVSTKLTSLKLPKSVVLDDGQAYQVTKVGASACKGRTKLRSVSIPITVKSLGSYAFKGCTALKTVSFAKGTALTTVGSYAFKGCSSLKAISLGKKVTKVGAGAFSGCKRLSLVKLYSKKLTKKGVKGALRGSSVKKVRVAVGSKASNRSYAAKYRKVFAKANSGRSVAVYGA